MTREQRERLESETERYLNFVDFPCAWNKGEISGQLSVGMCQRVSIGLSICGKPKLLIADEPTASLDHDSRDGYLIHFQAPSGVEYVHIVDYP